MNAFGHAELSVKRRGGIVDDYYHIHSFLDETKELCSDNRHRILHNLWGVRRVVIPIFGRVIVNSEGKTVNVKDLCEQDHLLPDYSNKFIPTLSDFVDCICDLTSDEENIINEIHQSYHFTPQELDLLLSPLQLTGKLNSLLITHNSWFINRILGKIYSRNLRLRNFPLSTDLLFKKMNFSLWMDNGRNGFPRSSNQILDII